jgi:hypothetical protein
MDEMTQEKRKRKQKKTPPHQVKDVSLAERAGAVAR